MGIASKILEAAIRIQKGFLNDISCGLAFTAEPVGKAIDEIDILPVNPIEIRFGCNR